MLRHAVLASVVLFVAGCSGPNPDPSGVGSVASGEPIPDAASILGVVVDDSHAPIPQAEVGLADTALRSVTDEAGAFAFYNVAPGDYVLLAGRLGFDTIAKKVTVAANEELRITVTLVAVAIVEPYHDTFGPFQGYFDCQVGTPIAISPCTGDTLHRQDLNSLVFPGDRRRLAFNMTSEEWQTMIGEARWPRTSVATSQGMAAYPSYSKRETSHWWCEADGPSPIAFRYEKEGESVCASDGVTTPEPSMKINPLVLVADAGFGGTTQSNPPARLILQQKFELMMTVFYHEPAPTPYTAFPDS